MNKTIGYYRVCRPNTFEDGVFYPVMHYKIDGTPGQCCSIREDELQTAKDANAAIGWREVSPNWRIGQPCF